MNLSFSEEALSTCMEELFPLEHSPPSGLDDVEILESLSLPTAPPPVDSEKFPDFALSFSEEALSTCMEELFPLEHSPPSGLDDDDVEILESLSLPTAPFPVDSEKFPDFALSFSEEALSTCMEELFPLEHSPPSGLDDDDVEILESLSLPTAPPPVDSEKFRDFALSFSEEALSNCMEELFPLEHSPPSGLDDDDVEILESLSLPTAPPPVDSEKFRDFALSFSEEALSNCMEELFPLEHSPPSGLDDDDVEILESLSLPTAPPPVDSENFRDFARSRLNAECAFVAMTWANRQKSTVVAENGSQPSDALGLSHQVPFRGSSYGVSMEQEKGGPLGLSSSQAMQKKPVADVKSMTCGNGLEAETATSPRNMDLSEEKLRKRLTNREAARRSRYRKKEELKELVAKVFELKSKHTSLLKNLSDIQQKHNGEVVEHELLKAELDYLRAQVKTKEMERFFAAMPEISTKDMQLFAAMQDDQTQTLSQPFPGIQNGFQDKCAIPAAQCLDGAFEATNGWGIGTDHSATRVSSNSVACEKINSNAACT